MLFIKLTLQKFKLNWQCNSKSLFRHFKPCKHASCSFTLELVNSLDDVIILAGTINTLPEMTI